MVCRNCGADLKPGIKYCLNCGEYLTQEEIDLLETGEENSSNNDIESNFSVVSENTRPKKAKNKVKDMVIYGVLFAILIISIIVIIVSNMNSGKEEIIEKPITYEDKVVKMSDYKITFSGKLNYAVEGTNVFITDDSNYIFSYKVVEAKYEDYLGDFLEKELIKGGNEVLNNEIKTVDSNDFIIYTFNDGKSVRYLYVIKIDDSRIVMGNIEEKAGGKWSEALNVIVKINESIQFLDSDGNVVGGSSDKTTFDSDVINNNKNS